MANGGKPEVLRYKLYQRRFAHSKSYKVGGYTAIVWMKAEDCQSEQIAAKSYELLPSVRSRLQALDCRPVRFQWITQPAAQITII